MYIYTCIHRYEQKPIGATFLKKNTFDCLTYVAAAT